MDDLHAQIEYDRAKMQIFVLKMIAYTLVGVMGATVTILLVGLSLFGYDFDAPDRRVDTGSPDRRVNSEGPQGKSGSHPDTGAESA